MGEEGTFDDDAEEGLVGSVLRIPEAVTTALGGVALARVLHPPLPGNVISPLSPSLKTSRSHSSIPFGVPIVPAVTLGAVVSGAGAGAEAEAKVRSRSLSRCDCCIRERKASAATRCWESRSMRAQEAGERTRLRRGCSPSAGAAVGAEEAEVEGGSSAAGRVVCDEAVVDGSLVVNAARAWSS